MSFARRLRLFAPRETYASTYASEPPDVPVGTGGSPALRLSDVLEVYLAFRRPADPGPYSLAVRRWAEATGDPPLSGLQPHHVAQFISYLANLGLSHATVRRDVRHAQALMNFAGPRNGRGRSGPWELGLYGFVPIRAGGVHGLWPRSAPELPRPAGPKEVEGTARPVWTADQRRAVWLACAVAERPRLAEVSACQWWRSALDVATGAGLRRRTILALERTWLQEVSPGVWVLDIPGRAMKSGRRTIIYASRLVREAIVAMPTGDVVFPWPYRVHGTRPNWNLLHKEFQRIMQAAGLPAQARRGAGFHSCRRATGDWLYCRDPAAARDTLGHASEVVTRAHYTQAISRALAAAPHLEQLAELELSRR